MSECERVREILAWPSRHWNPDERAHVQAHLARCVECATLAHRYTEQEQLLQRTRPENLTLPQWRELEARLRPESRARAAAIGSFPSRERRAWMLTTAILVALLATALARPDVVAVAAQQVERIVQRVVLDTYTSLVRISHDDPVAASTPVERPATPVVKRKGQLWIVQTPIGNFAGDALPGRSLEIQRFSTWEEILAAAPFAVRRPTYLPPRYTFREAMVTPGDWVLLFYDGGLVIAQMPSGPLPGDGPEHFSVAVGLLTEQPIEEVTLDGQPAGWVQGFGLMWKEDGISYTVGGPGLGVDEATRIARSMQ